MAQLPPKIPNQNWPPAFSPNQRMPPLTNITPSPPPAPPQPPSSAVTTTTTPSWMDEFLDFTSARRGSHRRSMSDSIAFLEAPALVEGYRNNSLHGGCNGSAFDRLDDEQLMSMFSDDISGGAMVGGPPSSPSDQNSNNDEDKQPPAMSTDNNNNSHQPPPRNLAKSEPGEVESACNSDHPPPPAPPSAGGDPFMDHKRVKRILANRQSAQRSRVRKLQYISELERSVTTLQTEVSALSPRVAFLDHQRLILNVDNSALKQRIAALAQDKIFKDAHQEALKKEIERLRQIYHHQQNRNSNSATAPPLSLSDHTNKEQLMT